MSAEARAAVEAAERRGQERSGAYLDWLKRDVDARAVLPLEAFRFEFDDSAASLQARAREEADGAADRLHSAEMLAAEERLRRIAQKVASPPANLTAFEHRLWVAFCEADLTGLGALSRALFEEALAAVGLGALSASEAASRWRSSSRNEQGLVPWVAFKVLGTQYRAQAELARREAAAAAFAARSRDEARAATVIQVRVAVEPHARACAAPRPHHHPNPLISAHSRSRSRSRLLTLMLMLAPNLALILMLSLTLAPSSSPSLSLTLSFQPSLVCPVEISRSIEPQARDKPRHTGRDETPSPRRLLRRERRRGRRSASVHSVLIPPERGRARCLHIWQAGFGGGLYLGYDIGQPL